MGSLAGKESVCSAGDPSSISGKERSTGEGRVYPMLYFLPSLGGSASKESACNVGDLGSILVWEDPLGKGTAIHSGILESQT